MMQVPPIVAIVGVLSTGLLYALGKAPALLPLTFWLVMAVWVLLRFKDEREERERLLDRIANGDR